MVAHKRAGNKANSHNLFLNGEDVSKLFDDLNIKIVAELINNPDISSTDIAAKYGIPLSTIQRRRVKLEESVLSKAYNLDVRELGWRTADLLISVEKGKAEETAREQQGQCYNGFTEDRQPSGRHHGGCLLQRFNRTAHPD